MPPPPFLRHTVDISVQLPAGTLSVDVANYIHQFFEGKFTVKSIQQRPGRVARVTFEEPEARVAVEELQRIELNGVSCPVVVPQPPPPRYSNVFVYLYPYESSDQPIADFCGHYGDVDSVRFQHWTNLPDIATGTRIVRMVRRGHIPRFVIINGYRCKVWYKGQPLKCDICSGDHKAASCPHKGKCIRCGEKGHFARNCQNAWGNAAPAEAAPGQPGDPSVDPVVADEVSDPPSGVDPPTSDPVQVVVVEEGCVTPVSGIPPSTIDDDVVDERLNQLDELASSQSILQNCSVRQFDFLSVDGSNSNGNCNDNGTTINDSRVNNITSDDSNDIDTVINNDRVSIENNIIGSDNVVISNNDNPNSFNADPNSNSNGSGPNLGGISSVPNSNINYYGSAVSATPLDSPADCEMSVVSGLQSKRPLSEVSSSEDPIGEFSSDPPDSALAAKSRLGRISDSVLALSSKSKGANKRTKKNVGHLPAGVASASRLLPRPKR